MSRKIISSILLLASILFSACGNKTTKDVVFSGKYPRITTICYSENNNTYDIPAVAGHCIVLFVDTASRPTAKDVIKANGGKIIEQIPAFNYYLVKVKEGEENTFVSSMNKRSDVEYAFFNTLVQFASEVYIFDDFQNIEESMLTTHGNGVRKTFSKYSVSDNVHSEDMVFLTNSDSLWRKKTTTSNVILSNLLKAAKNTANDDLMLVNMSFGVKLPGMKTDYDKYDDVDTNDRKLYVKLYAQELKQLAKCFNKMRAKGISNFIVTKSSGNYRMHSIQDILALLDEKTINTLKDNLVLVCAYDTKSEKQYSNYTSQKHPLLTTIDVSKEPWAGTSFASPKLMGFIDKIHGKYDKLNAQQLLQAIRNATPEDPRIPMTYEMLEREAKKLAKNNEGSKRYCFRLDMTSDYNGEWDLSEEHLGKIVKYEVHNTFGYDYLNGEVMGLYLENNTDQNLNVFLDAINSERDIIPMHYTLASGEKQGFFAYQHGIMKILSVKEMEVQLSIW